ncbi:MAG: hypothetical protein KKB50_02780 [Planctomycetes bacterium]|nr:hypothetical protein [Planctomycetota bacterium]
MFQRVSLMLIVAGLLGLLGPEVSRAQQPLQNEAEAAWFRNVRQLTSPEMGLARSGEAYFSPDMKRISFQAYPRGREQYQIYVMNIDGTGLKMVSTDIGATTCSHFHPSGERLIFAANHHDLREPEEPQELEAYRPRQTDGAGAQGHPGEHPGNRAGGHPGGQGQGQGGHAWKYFPGMEIYEYTFATTRLRRLTHSDGYDAECTYSPDGRSIVFSSMRDGDLEIYICDADGQNARRITNAPGKDGGPFFSPDGKRLVYRSERYGDGNLQLFVNNCAGTAEHALTGHDVFNWCPYWHPSGKWIIFTRADFRGRPNFDLYLLRDDGSEVHRVTSAAAFDGLPVFSPDGRYLMWTSRRGGIDAPQIFIAEFTGLSPSGELLAMPGPGQQ